MLSKWIISRNLQIFTKKFPNLYVFYFRGGGHMTTTQAAILSWGYPEAILEPYHEVILDPCRIFEQKNQDIQHGFNPGP